MMDVKQAAKLASDYFNSLYETQSLSNVLLEEVELTENGEYWLITLSYPAQPETVSSIFGTKRQYKVFKINAETGEVQSMKIRKID
ncbi:MAG TPA: hypothetical protein VF064_09330 [Pyrinomonadaceae bacterium]